MTTIAIPQAEARVPLELQAVFLESSRLETIEEAPITEEATHGRLACVRRWLKNHQPETPKTPTPSGKLHSQSAETDQVDITDSTNSPSSSRNVADELQSTRKRQDTSQVRRVASAPVISQTPPSALKTKPRIPLELQAVFLESSRTGIVDKPAPKAASRIFGVRWSPAKKKSTPPKAMSDGTLDCSMLSSKASSNLDAKPRRPLLNFGANETIVFEKRKPTNTRFNIDKTCCTSIIKQKQPRQVTPSRWSSGLDQKEAGLATMPRPVSRRFSKELEGKALEPARCF